MAKKYVQVNPYTWVKTKDVEAWKKRANEGSFSREETAKESKPRVNHDYADFVNEIFEERKYISRSKLHKKIIKRFGSNTTYYRRMMLKQKLMSKRNGLYKPIDHE